MKHQVTLDTVILITRYLISPIGCWPPDDGSSGLAVLRYNFLVCMGIVFLVFHIAVSIYDIHRNAHETIHIIKIITELVAITSALSKMIICRIESLRLQVLINEMERFLKKANEEEKELIQSCVNKFLIPHTIACGTVTIGELIFMAMPLFESGVLPAATSYPFSVELSWVWFCAYLGQCICGIFSAAMIYTDIFYASLLWYACARFRILARQFQRATNADDVSHCVRKHQELIRNVDNLRASTRFVAVGVEIIMLFSITCGGFILISRDSTMLETVQYALYEFGSATELFFLTWPADNLIEASMEVGQAAYNCDWIGRSPKMLKDILLVIRRSQKPVDISVSGILPPLSLEFYSRAVTASVSYIATLRAFTGE